MSLTAYLSVNRVKEKQSLFSETPKLNEQLQRYSQAAELGHKIGSVTLKQNLQANFSSFLQFLR